MARFKKGNTAIHVQNIRGRVNPALIVRKDGDAEVVAFFKGEYEAKLFSGVLAELIRASENGGRLLERMNNAILYGYGEEGKDGKAD